MDTEGVVLAENALWVSFSQRKIFHTGKRVNLMGKHLAAIVTIGAIFLSGQD